MRQILFRIPGVDVPIFGYGAMLFLAFVGSMNLAAWRARREKLDEAAVYDLALYIFLGGLIGARAFYVWQYWGERIRTVWDVFKIWEGGIVFYGSVMGGAAAFFLYWAWRRFPLRPMLDVVAPSMAVGIALGRLGCFLNGCCYGDRCDLPWAVRFPASSPPWIDQVRHGLIPESALASLAVHPTQLYSAFDGLILLLLLTAYFPIRRRDGEVMALLMVTYPVTRFLIEHLRNDEGVFFAGLTISQNLSIGIFLCGLLFWGWLWRQPVGRHVDTVVDPSPEAASVAASAPA
jgi:phosphatidylglycerol:prolipoprotein diacylglycerol transferase